MKLPTVQGREIVSVRLIPLITHAWLGQVTLSGILANKIKVNGWPYPSDSEQVEVNIYDEETDCTELTKISRSKLIGFQQRNNLGFHSYHLNNDGEAIKMQPSEWEAIYRDISVLEPLLRKVEEKNEVPDSMESAWRLKATEVLPPGVFLWRDDLDLLWQSHISSFIVQSNEPTDFREMNFDAYIRPEYLSLAWEGFEHLKQSSSKLTDTMTTAKGGAPKGPLAEAVQYAYLKFLEEGNTEIIRKGKIRDFLARFKEMADDSNRNFSDYVAERIRTVKITPSSCTITTQEMSIKPRIKREGRTYSQAEVSKLLSGLRKNHQP